MLNLWTRWFTDNIKTSFWVNFAATHVWRFLHLQPLVLLLLQILFYELFTLITDNHLTAACCLFKVLTVLRSSGVRRDCSGPDLQVGGRTNCWCNITVASGATLPLWPRWGLHTPDRVGFHNADEHQFFILTSKSVFLESKWSEVDSMFLSKLLNQSSVSYSLIDGWKHALTSTVKSFIYKTQRDLNAPQHLTGNLISARRKN